MEPVSPSFPDPEHADDLDEQERHSKRGRMLAALGGLKGWQAVPAAIVALYLLLGVFGPTLAPFEVNEGTIAARLCPPLGIDALRWSAAPTSRIESCSSTHIFGTDQLGKDVFSRVLHGARTSLRVVGSSVLIGTILGAVIGVWINGLRSRSRWVGYAVVVATAVPFGIFVLGQPDTLSIFNVLDRGDGNSWPLVTSLSGMAFVFTFALVAVGYWLDDRCVRFRIKGLETEGRTHGFFSLLGQQVMASWPWIALSAMASAALIIPASNSTTLVTTAMTWSLEHDYLLEHVGMFGPIVPIVVFSVAFVFLGVWWVYRGIMVRFDSPRSAELARNDAAERLITRRRALGIIGIVVVLLMARFVVVEALPTLSGLTQGRDAVGRGGEVQNLLERNEAINCANETSSRLMALRGGPATEGQVDPGERCLDLYYKQRNAPTHRWTFDYVFRFMTQTLMLSLIGGVAAAALWIAGSGLTMGLRKAVQVLVVIVALTGMTVTFGYYAWYPIFSDWFGPSVGAANQQELAIRSAINMFRDLSVAFGISYLIASIARSTLRFSKRLPMFDVMSDWVSYLVPCVLLTSGLMVVFHYPFPTNLFFVDDFLGVIADPSEGPTYISGTSLFRNWMWTYWFALIGYAAMVVAFFAVAILGFRWLVASDTNHQCDQLAVSPDSPSQDGGSI